MSPNKLFVIQSLLLTKNGRCDKVIIRTIVGLLVLVILPRPHSKCVVAGGDIIKAKFGELISILQCFLKRLHKEKVASSVKIEATNSNVIIINIHKD